MANSRYDFHKEDEKLSEPRFNRGTYIIVRIDGHHFHEFCPEHKFHKPNDKRALDLMVESAKQVLRTYRGHIPFAYGHSDEFSFLIRSSSSLLSRRVYKITSMLPVIFATYYNSNWDRFFCDPNLGEVTPRKRDAWFDARPKEYSNSAAVIDYFRWRQVDCHINNLYNTTLNALTGRYVKYELIPVEASIDCDISTFDDGSGDGRAFTLKRTPITTWIKDSNMFLSPKQATERLSGTEKAEKHDIMFKDFRINYNNELEQFKKGTIVVDTHKDYRAKKFPEQTIIHSYRELTSNMVFWNENKHIFDDQLMPI